MPPESTSSLSFRAVWRVGTVVHQRLHLCVKFVRRNAAHFQLFIIFQVPDEFGHSVPSGGRMVSELFEHSTHVQCPFHKCVLFERKMLWKFTKYVLRTPI